MMSGIGAAEQCMIDDVTGLPVVHREQICIGVHDTRGTAMATHIAYTWSHDIAYAYGKLPRSCQIFSVYARQLPPATTANLWPGQMTTTGLMCRTSSYRQNIHALVIIADVLQPSHELSELAAAIRAAGKPSVVCVLLDTTMLSNQAQEVRRSHRAASQVRRVARIKSALDLVGAWASTNNFIFSAFDAGQDVDTLNAFFQQVVFLARPEYQLQRRMRQATCIPAYDLPHSSPSSIPRHRCSRLVVRTARIALQFALINAAIFVAVTALLHARGTALHDMFKVLQFH